MNVFRLSFVAALLIGLLAATAIFAPHAEAASRPLIKVPPGNRSATQPAISYSSIKRTADTGGDFEAKYRKVLANLASDPQLIAKIKQAAAAYSIDPVHILGAIVGEHTYNVDVVDNLQGYYVKALEYLGTNITFAYQGMPIDAFVARPEFKRCAATKGSYAVWSCREDVWTDTFRGRTVAGVAYPDDRFEKVFFQPFFAGQTFGLGQLSPLTALMVSDLVHQRSGLPELDMRRASEVYHAVMDPDTTLLYIAAVIRSEIDIYKDVAGFDVSGNPGITATLYNLGGAEERARALAAANAKRRGEGLGPLYPQENYYGWLVNSKLADLKGLL